MLTRGPLLDSFGQYKLREWSGKTHSEEELVARLRKQASEAAEHRWPHDFSRWGGWTKVKVEGSGFFRTHYDGQRWWLIDPDGHPFWSTGLDCVRVDTAAAVAGIESALEWLPEKDGPFAASIHRAHSDEAQVSVNYLAANLMRAFGPDDWRNAWAKIALGELRRLGFNTVANWSDWQIARGAGFPYVVPLNPSLPHSQMIFRDFPDVFDPAFAADAGDYAEQLRPFAGDPALLGYFLMNEPNWAFAGETPAAGMLATTPSCATRRALAEFLRGRYTDASFKSAWGVEAPLSAVAEGTWKHSLNERATRELEEFSTIMIERYFGTLSRACKAVDADHLNLGMRYYTVPPPWAMAGMKNMFDVFSINCYKQQVPPESVAEIAAGLGIPVMVGEWHFGALDVGLPGSGIGRVADQHARGRAYRYYVENAAALPACVGVHWFTMYDESAAGRFDGENWNTGFYDVCGRPYEPLCRAARGTHEHQYRIAAGEETPFNDPPEFLPLVFN